MAITYRNTKRKERRALGTGRRVAVRGARTGHGPAARSLDHAPAAGQRSQGARQSSESSAVAAPACQQQLRRILHSGRVGGRRHGQEAAPHSASRRPLRRPIRFRYRGDTVHRRDSTSPFQGIQYIYILERCESIDSTDCGARRRRN